MYQYPILNAARKWYELVKQFPHNALVLCGDLQLTKNLWQDRHAALAVNTICITDVYGGGEDGKNAP
jgi:hypothetical protein